MLLAVALLLALSDSLGLLQQSSLSMPQAGTAGADAAAVSDERVEIHNSGSGAVNLVGYRLTDGGWTIPEGAVIVPGETVTLLKPESDWIELHNGGSEAVNLSGYSVAGSGWTITEDTVIEPGEQITIYC